MDFLKTKVEKTIKAFVYLKIWSYWYWKDFLKNIIQIFPFPNIFIADYLKHITMGKAPHTICTWDIDVVDTTLRTLSGC